MVQNGATSQGTNVKISAKKLSEHEPFGRLYVRVGRDSRLSTMSQHHISTKRYRILIGWDRPLQYFFGTVWEKAQSDQHDGGVVLSTLSLPGGGASTIAELARLLRPYVELPPHLMAALTEDQAVNRGNAFHEWKLDVTNPE
jgi:hypothetical protein